MDSLGPLPVVDGHNDLPWALRTKAGSDLTVADPRRRLDGFHTDFPRLLEGGVGLQFWSVYVPSWSESPLRLTLEQIDLTRRMCALPGAPAEIVATADDAERARTSGRVAGMLGAEGGHCIENSLGALRMLYRLGVRYLTLTHAETIDWADSSTDDARHGGLTPFGEDVVREMNRLGMIVDVSHVSDDTVRQAVQVSGAPVIASHSSAHALAPHPRNLKDDLLEVIGRQGGVVMVNFYPPFVVAGAAAARAGDVEMARELRTTWQGDDADFVAEVERRLAEIPVERGTVDDVVDHIEHVAAVAGVDRVGLGSDFDGIDLTPVGLEDVSAFPAVAAALRRRHWSEPDIAKVLGDNARRVLRAVEAAAEPE